MMLKTVLIALFTLFLQSCQKEEKIEPVKEVVRPVKTTVVQEPITGGIRHFPARIDANQKTVLSFRVDGHVKELLVKEGEMVEPQQIVAKLDPTDFQIIVNDRQASYEKARKNFNRAKELIKKGYISKTDYDRLEAEYKNARAALETAKQDLAYTILKAPFDGLISKRYVEQYEEIRAGQPIMDLQNISKLEVKFNIPEAIIRSLQIQKEGEKRIRHRLIVHAEFDNLPGQSIPLQFKEITTEADPQTQTFEITYTMDQLKNAKILPGMTATVTVDFSEVLQHKKPVYLLPVEAVVGDYKLEPRIWVVTEDMQAKPVKVKVGKMIGRYIEIEEGVKAGMRVVTAGAAFLHEGMKVKPLPNLEQAEPRQDQSCR